MPFERHCIISKKLQSKKSDKTGHHGHMLFCSFGITLSLVTASQICFKEAESASVSRSVMSDSLPPHGLWPVRILFPRNSPGKNTGVGSHSLLLTQGWILGLPHCIEILYQLSPIGCNLAKLSVELPGPPPFKGCPPRCPPFLHYTDVLSPWSFPVHFKYRSQPDFLF